MNPTASSSSTSHPEPGASQQEVHALSCINCRHRKVKCAKVYPCPHCVRGGLECIFPSRKKDRAPRRNRNHELLSRLAKLEAIVGQAEPSSTAASLPAVAPTTTAASATTGLTAARLREMELRNPQKRCPVVEPASRDDPAAKYVSGEFWANLSTEVEGIKAALEMPSDTEEEDDEEGGGGGEGDDSLSPESGTAAQDPQLLLQQRHSSHADYAVSAAMFGNPQVASNRPRHPPPERIKKLRETYFYTVDPLLKILHRPTVERQLDLFIVNPEDNTPSLRAEALWFAIYFAAVTSLSPAACVEKLGEERALLVAEYRQGVEVALARADYLNNTSLETLQALTIYDACLRSHTRSRASWALLALVLRLSQASGLQRDGNGSAFSPYEAEMRRRLWAQVIVLDVRASQDRGTEPMIMEEMFNTIPPSNIDDADFGPDTTVPVPQLARGIAATDITFSLCTYHCSCLYLHIHGPRSKFFKPAAGADDPSSSAGAAGGGGRGAQAEPTSFPPPQGYVAAQASEEDVIERIKALEAKFVAPALSRPDHFPSVMAAAVVRLTTLIIWLTIQYPFRVRQPTIKPRVSREHMLQTAVAILDLSASGPATAGTAISEAEWHDRFAWWQDGYVQWHAVAVTLAELCVQTDGPLVERSWVTVERALAMWGEKVADSKRGALWRPIRKLLRKARERRTEAQLRRLRLQGGGEAAAASSSSSSSAPAPAPAPAASQAKDKQRVRTGYHRDPEQSHIPIPRSPREVLAKVWAREAAEGHRSPMYADWETPAPAEVTQAQPQQATAPLRASPARIAATEVGPTGILFTPDFGNRDTSMAESVPTPTTATTTAAFGTSSGAGMRGPQPVATPPALFLENAHNTQWNIDFGDMDDTAVAAMANIDPALQVQQQEQNQQMQLDMMDWSAWNDFVADANVSLEDGTSPSSEGKAL